MLDSILIVFANKEISPHINYISLLGAWVRTRCIVDITVLSSRLIIFVEFLSE